MRKTAGVPRGTSSRVADRVAAELRRRIVEGELADGDSLPKQDDIIREFDVSRPSAREALRILEAEGLLTVRRGGTGGSVVHLPQPEGIAYTMALALRSQDTTLGDIGVALQQLEPLCASLCAMRPDRGTAVLPGLRAAQDDLAAAIDADDQAAGSLASRRFHEQLVATCGNDALALMAGAVESLWTTQQQDWAQRAVAARVFPERALREHAWNEHEEILGAIAAGDTDAVVTSATAHLVQAQRFPLAGGDPPVSGLPLAEYRDRRP